jgi:hypothetical protein
MPQVGTQGKPGDCNVLHGKEVKNLKPAGKPTISSSETKSIDSAGMHL